ncbi:hypothetical protein CIPAW_08G122700 [Carya illinoinensis]|uniref:Uncharacterized protein n=1 Tax=Carya illinoinensis TaxID=32201 RepID=A0A8T1PUF0_CARIL|nr:hypothetical protein CIPAW_08G122700 [Carya illinoinensis]
MSHRGRGVSLSFHYSFHSNAWTIFTNSIAGIHTEGKK